MTSSFEISPSPLASSSSSMISMKSSHSIIPSTGGSGSGSGSGSGLGSSNSSHVAIIEISSRSELAYTVISTYPVTKKILMYSSAPPELDS